MLVLVPKKRGNFEHLFNFEANIKMVSGSGSNIFSNCGSGFRIWILDPDPGFDDLKLKKIYSWKFNFYYLDQKLQFTYP
jgi:hypothetical protein